jgi:hypothetical protein
LNLVCLSLDFVKPNWVAVSRRVDVPQFGNVRELGRLSGVDAASHS